MSTSTHRFRRPLVLVAALLLAFLVTGGTAVRPTPHAAARPHLHLGDPLTAFIVVYGKPLHLANNSDIGWMLCPDKNTFQFQVIVDQGHVGLIESIRCKGKTNAAARAVAAHPFFPTDAVRAGSVEAVFGGFAPAYVSKTLGRRLPVKDFINCNEKKVTPGTFVYDDASEATDDWSLAAGRCPIGSPRS